MLMALGEPLPKQVFGHPWLLFGEDKMSKSRGNVIYADDLISLFGVDAVRYYLLSEMPYASDGSITYETMIERYNSDLANTIGNLVNRTISMNKKYFDSVIQAPTVHEPVDDDLAKFCTDAVAKVEKLFETYRVADAVEAVVGIAKRANKYIDETEPWVLARDEAKKARLGTVLYNLFEAIRYLAVMIRPFMPETSDRIFEQTNMNAKDYDSLAKFGALEPGIVTGKAKPLFARVDKEEMFKEIDARQKEVAARERANNEKVKEKLEEKAEGVAQISIDDFGKVELRICEIKACEKIKRAKKLLKLSLDDGTEGRTVVSGIAPWYEPDDLVGHKVVVVSNLKPAKLCGVESQGMILAADTSDGNVSVLFADGMETGAVLR